MGNVVRCASFLTVLGIHCISRSFPLPPQRMPASPAAASAVAGPASHAHPAASKRPRNQTPHAHAARCVGVPAAARPSASHAGRGDTLEAPCCRTRRRRRAKHRLREREAVPQRQAVPIVAPSTPRAAPAPDLGDAHRLSFHSERVRESVCERERALLGTIHNGGSRAAPAHGLCTTLARTLHHAVCFHTHT